MDRLVGTLGVSVIDELGTVPANLLHADALRKTYGRCLRYNIDTTRYMHPQEAWGRVFAKLLCGDFLQLPPVPSTASFMAPVGHTTSYEHRQGRKLLMDMKYVVDFVNMQRFDDPLLVEVLHALRTPGGKKISDEAWRTIFIVKLETTVTTMALSLLATILRKFLHSTSKRRQPVTPIANLIAQG